VKARTVTFVGIGLLVPLLLAAVVSYYASSRPDGLERVATDTGLNAGEKDQPLGDTPLADYGTRGVDDPRLSRGVAGIVGIVATFVVAGGIVYVVKRRGSSS